jgi:chromosome segregation ATPase
VPVPDHLIDEANEAADLRARLAEAHDELRRLHAIRDKHGEPADLAARLAQVERERDELAAVVAATWAHVTEEGQEVDPARLADRTDELLRMVCAERDDGYEIHAREIEEFRADWLAAIDEANDRRNERDEARAALERAREALGFYGDAANYLWRDKNVRRPLGAEVVSTNAVDNDKGARARAALDALPDPTTTAEEKRDGADAIQR